MDEILRFVKFLGAHPLHGFALVLGLAGVGFLSLRKSRLTREADQRLKDLRKERGDHYNRLRPLR